MRKQRTALNRKLQNKSITTARRYKVRAALLESALVDHDPKARDEVEAFLSAEKGKIHPVIPTKQPHSLSFDHKRAIDKSILSNWYKTDKYSYANQQSERNKMINLSSSEERHKALQLFKLK